MKIEREGKHTYIDGTFKGYWTDFTHNGTAYYGSIVKVGPIDTECAIFRGQKCFTMGEPLKVINGVAVKRKTLIDYIEQFCKEQGGVNDEWEE